MNIDDLIFPGGTSSQTTALQRVPVAVVPRALPFRGRVIYAYNPRNGTTRIVEPDDHLGAIED